MARSDDKLERAKSAVTDLESFRRLIELQKEMIELSQHHEKSRRECDALRDVVAREVATRARQQNSAAGKLRSSASKLLKLSPFAFARQLFS